MKKSGSERLGDVPKVKTQAGAKTRASGLQVVLTLPQAGMLPCSQLRLTLRSGVSVYQEMGTSQKRLLPVLHFPHEPALNNVQY